MKKILLMVPRCNGPAKDKKWNKDWSEELEKAVSNSLWKVVTPGVLVLASMVNKSEFCIELVDEEFREVDKSNNYDIVAMYTVTPNAKRAYMWAEYFRKKGSYIVLGGVHAVVCHSEAENHADTLLLGECENIWTEFLTDFINGNPKKKYIQALGEVDVDKSPVPAFELLPVNARKIIPIQTARGCPHGCSFCNLRSIYGKSYRPKSINNINEEIKSALLVNSRAILYFTDDNLFCNKERGLELVKMIKQYGVTWYAHTDVSFADNEELIKEAYESGCRQVLIGFESINPDNLKGIDENNFKNQYFTSYKNVVNEIQSNGIGVVGSFIMGLEEDDKDSFDKMLKFIRDTKLYGASITMNTPYPGTKLFEKMKKENRILTYDWDEYTIFQLVIKPYKIKVEELNKEYIRLLREINSTEAVIDKMNYFKEQFKRLKG